MDHRYILGMRVDATSLQDATRLIVVIQYDFF